MIIVLSPVASMNAPKMQISISGLMLTINNQEFDLSVIPERGQAEAEEGGHFIGIVTRDRVVIRYPYDSLKAEPNQSINWDDYTFDVTEGEVPCPIKWLPEPEATTQEDADFLPIGINDEMIEAYNSLGGEDV
ncbi:hypothetical protein [Vibrio metschnikovii]|uniref:hypothetical protein n=1 Tax=Vibrio metschnikovii TaxID=28172 RepID=UPI001302E0C1|nr:hypothetical protein [Vibrio metschnikovii]